MPEMLPLAEILDLGLPLTGALIPAHSFVAALVVRLLGAILTVCGVGTYAKVATAIVESIAIDVIDVEPIEHQTHAPRDLVVHRMLHTRITALAREAAPSITLTALPVDIPDVSVTEINDRKLPLRQRNADASVNDFGGSLDLRRVRAKRSFYDVGTAELTSYRQALKLRRRAQLLDAGVFHHTIWTVSR